MKEPLLSYDKALWVYMISSDSCSWLQDPLKTELLLVAIFLNAFFHARRYFFIRFCVICNQAGDMRKQ